MLTDGPNRLEARQPVHDVRGEVTGHYEAQVGEQRGAGRLRLAPSEAEEGEDAAGHATPPLSLPLGLSARTSCLNTPKRHSSATIR